MPLRHAGAHRAPACVLCEHLFKASAGIVIHPDHGDEFPVAHVEKFATGLRIVSAYSGAVAPISFMRASAGDHFLLTSSTPGVTPSSEGICRWHVDSGELALAYPESGVLPLQHAFMNLADGRGVLAAATDEGILRWDGYSGAKLPDSPGLTNGTKWGVAAALLPNGRAVLAGAGPDSEVGLCDAWTGEELKQLAGGHRSTVKSVLFVELPGDSMLIFSGDDHGVVQRWDAISGQMIGGPLCDLGGIVNLLTSYRCANGQAIVVCGTLDGDLRCFDAATGEAIGRPISVTCDEYMLSLAVLEISGALRVFASTTEEVVTQWDIQTGSMAADPQSGYTVAATILTDGTPIIATGESNGDIIIRRLPMG